MNKIGSGEMEYVECISDTSTYTKRMTAGEREGRVGDEIVNIKHGRDEAMR